MNSNPYQPADASERSVAFRPAHRLLWAALGFAIVCLPLATLGAYSLHQFYRVAATLPADATRCGMGAVVAMALIFPVAPALGCVGAALGFFAAIIRDCILLGGTTTEHSRPYQDSVYHDTAEPMKRLRESRELLE